jgi:hypothetical protein
MNGRYIFLVKEFVSFLTQFEKLRLIPSWSFEETRPVSVLSLMTLNFNRAVSNTKMSAGLSKVS